jgi:fructose transport system permease protein
VASAASPKGQHHSVAPDIACYICHPHPFIFTPASFNRSPHHSRLEIDPQMDSKLASSTEASPGDSPVQSGESASDSFTHKRGPFAAMQHALHRYPVLSPATVLLLSFIAFSFFNTKTCGPRSCGEAFRSSGNVGTMVQQYAVIAALAVGQTLIILTAGVDLSVGTAMLLVHLVMAKMFIDFGLSPILSILIAMVAGAAIGAIHGLLITRLSLPPFIVTLGTFYMFGSIALIYSGAKDYSAAQMGDSLKTRDTEGLLNWAGNPRKILGIPFTNGVFVMFALYIVMSWVLANTAWGRHVYATGNDKEAARLAGIDVARVLISVYMVAGIIYAIGGWMQIGRVGSASAKGAVDYNLLSITAVVIGGTSIFGGRGRLWGTLIGACIVATFDTGLSLWLKNQNWKNFAIGSLIIIAVTLDQWIRKVAK